MRYGFTTGSCAAAAAKACAYMLLTGKEKTGIFIDTPKGIRYEAALLDIKRSEQAVSLAVRKDGGDDPDITTGTLIYATVAYAEEQGLKQKSEKGTGHVRLYIDGGEGIGRVTKPGLDQPIGNAAINHVPREMIEKEVREICELTDFTGALSITISAPEGERLAAKTFNPRLGIIGGISILGTSGIVEPMSSQALLATIRLELTQKKAEGCTGVAVTPGNYGQAFMKSAYHYDLDSSVKCSNYIGETIDMAAELGFHKLLLTGHIGKLVKLAGGIMNTHSREGDCRMELIAAAAVRQRVPYDQITEILNCVTTEETVRLLEICQKKEMVMADLMEKMQFYLEKRAAGSLQIETIVYSNEWGELAKSSHAEEFVKQLMEEKL